MAQALHYKAQDNRLINQTDTDGRRLKLVRTLREMARLKWRCLDEIRKAACASAQNIARSEGSDWVRKLITV